MESIQKEIFLRFSLTGISIRVPSFSQPQLDNADPFMDAKFKSITHLYITDFLYFELFWPRVDSKFENGLIRAKNCF